MTKNEKTTLLWSCLWIGVSAIFSLYGKLVQTLPVPFFEYFMKMLITALPFFVCGWYIGRFLQNEIPLQKKKLQIIIFVILLGISVMWFGLLNMTR